MLTVLGGLAEFERELIRARTSEGRARATARGVHMGRPPALTRINARKRYRRLQRAKHHRPTLRGVSMCHRPRFRGLRHDRR